MLSMIPAVALVVAGILHIMLAPVHYAHAPAHGIFFALAGALEIVWSVAFLRKASRELYYMGLLLAGGLVVLWIITRFAMAPFEGEMGAVDLGGVVCKLSELVGIAALGALAVGGRIKGMPEKALLQTAGVALLLSLAGGVVSYGVGLALEPVFPSLAGAAEHNHGGEMAMGETESRTHAEGDGEVVATAGDLEILNPMSNPVQAGMTGGVFLLIRNNGHHEDHLIGARTDIAATMELHETVMQGDVMQMKKVDGGLEIPAGGILALEHGGYHLMLIDVQKALAAGDHFEITLEFEHAGPVTFEVHVTAP